MKLKNVIKEPALCKRKDGLLVVGLIVFIPFITRVHTVKVPRLPGTILVFPIIACLILYILLKIERFLFFVKLSFCFCLVQSLCGVIRCNSVFRGVSSVIVGDVCI